MELLMGAINQYEQINLEEHNLDKDGLYIQCRDCQSKLEIFEKTDDLCFLCKIEKMD
jgi:hypothetical protein